MSGYRKIAVAIDLSSESAAIMKRARDVAAPDSEIHLIYVQEPMDSVYMGVVPYGPVFVGMDEVEENLRSELREKLDAIGEKSGVPETARHFLSGTPAREIRRFAEENRGPDCAGHAWTERCAVIARRNRQLGAARVQLRCAGCQGFRSA